MTEYELRTPAGRPFMRFDNVERAKTFLAQHKARVGVTLRLFEVRQEAREMVA